MSSYFIWVGGMLIVCALMIFQLKSLTKYHPNAELLIGLLKMIEADKKTP